MLNRFYNTVTGKVIIDASIGLVVGYLIYLWRGNERALWMCSGVMGATAYLRARQIWPWSVGNKK
jgi:hypothetical protein